MSESDIKSRFLKDVANHQMEVRLDQGLHRDLRFSKNDSSTYHFNLTTWPGYLAITGDMGDYVFSRLADMFEFFRTDKGKINPYYWGQKCCASGSRPQEYSSEKFERNLRQCLQEMDFNGLLREEDAEDDEDYEKTIWFWDDMQDESHGPFDTYEAAIEDIRAAVWTEVEERVLSCAYDGEHYSYAAANEFESELTGRCFDDFYEMNCREYTFQYLWCCEAIVWGIAQYDALKGGPVMTSP